jgi:hypothetical protein
VKSYFEVATDISLYYKLLPDIFDSKTFDNFKPSIFFKNNRDFI